MPRATGKYDRGVLPGRRVYGSSATAPIDDAQRCVRRIERDGWMGTVCADGDDDRDDRLVARIEREQYRERQQHERERWLRQYERYHDDDAAVDRRDSRSHERRDRDRNDRDRDRRADHVRHD